MSVPYAMTEPTSVPAPRYYDAGFAALEDQRLWSRTWQMACRLEEIPSPGDFVEYTIAGQSLIVVRVDTGTIQAHHNACRHRGTELATGRGRFRSGEIVCPFHGWRWNLDGSNSFVYGAEGFAAELIEPADLCLPHARVGTWGGCVWVNLDPGALPLLESLDPMPGLLDPLGVDRMRVQWWKTALLDANWKLGMEAFVEGYHVMASHPQLTQGQGQAYDPNALAYSVHPGGHSHYVNRPGSQRRHREGVGPDNDVEALIESSRLLCEGLQAMTLPRDLRAIETLRHRPIPDGGSLGGELVRAIYEEAAKAGVTLPQLEPPALARWGGVFFVFPNYFVLPQYGNALCYRFRPVVNEPARCLMDLWSISIPGDGDGAGDPPGRPVMEGPFPADDAEHWPAIPLQDFANITRQQRGVCNRTFGGSPISHVYEVGIANLHREIDRYLAQPASS